MIQMRWITVPSGSGRGLLGRDDNEVFENVLQYREARKYTLGDAKVETFEGVDWIDVPIPGKVWPSGG